MYAFDSNYCQVCQNVSWHSLVVQSCNVHVVTLGFLLPYWCAYIYMNYRICWHMLQCNVFYCIHFYVLPYMITCITMYYRILLHVLPCITVFYCLYCHVLLCILACTAIHYRCVHLNFYCLKCIIMVNYLCVMVFISNLVGV